MSHSLAGEIPLPADPDAALVTAARKGDLDAFEALVGRHQTRMLNIAFRLTGEYDEACEAVQDAFVSAYRNLRSFRREARFSTWLTSITVNHAKNRLRRILIRRTRVPVSLDEPIRTGDGRAKLDPPSREPSVLDRMETRDIQVRVRGCIDALDPEFRDVIVLRDMQDLAYEEIAAVLQLAAGTVKSRLFRAREAVKECLKRVLGGL